MPKTSGAAARSAAAGRKASRGTFEKRQAEKRDDGTDHFGPSNATVVYNPDYRDAAGMKHLDDRIREVFGRRLSDRELASMVGAPDNARVVIEPGPNQQSFGLVIRSPEVTASREIYVAPNGDIKIHNNIIEVGKQFQGGGIGAKILARQVEQAAKLGVKEINANAARMKGVFNGYITWAKLGYDAPIPSAVRSKLPEGMKSATRIKDLMSTEKGVKFWTENGRSTDMVFDLTPGSYSRRFLAAYVKKKGY
jgi:GNAT superfamily N-acetyltransferase